MHVFCLPEKIAFHACMKKYVFFVSDKYVKLCDDFFLKTCILFKYILRFYVL